MKVNKERVKHGRGKGEKSGLLLEDKVVVLRSKE